MPNRVNAAPFLARKIPDTAYYNPVYELFTAPDYAYVVAIVGSLLALLFVFDAICGEKERGTLKQILANAVPRDAILLSKCLGGYIALAAPFFAATLAGVVYVHMSGVVVLEGDNLWRLLCIIAISSIYLLLFFNLGMMVSAATQRSATSLLIVLLVWICWILIIPNLAPVTARFISSVPSLQKVEREKDLVNREVELQARQAKDAVGREQIRLQGERRKQKLERFYKERLRDQIATAKTLSRLSPIASFMHAAADLAKTDTGLYTRFETAYRRFVDQAIRYVPNGYTPLKQPIAPQEAPRLEVLEPNFADTFTMIAVDLLLLGIFNVLFFLLAYLFFLRCDVT